VCRFAPDLAKALTNAGTAVPAELQKLAEQYEAKKAAGTAKKHGSGFGGHGFQFNDEEARKKKDNAILQAKLFGGDLAEGIEQDEERDLLDDDDDVAPSRPQSIIAPSSSLTDAAAGAEGNTEIAARVAAADANVAHVPVDVRLIV
jgi:ATP-dependent RNA helicase DDX46/PRP5